MCSLSSTALLLDVREVSEWNEHHIAGSFNFPLSQLEVGQLPEVGVNQEIILICKSGARARKAHEILKNMKFNNVHCSERGVYEY